jgi:hypothetical protein
MAKIKRTIDWKPSHSAASNIKPTSDWSKFKGPTATFDIKGIIKKLPKSQPTSIPVAPWVRDAYAAENIAREKKGQPPLTWTQFGEWMTNSQHHSKLIVGAKMLRKVQRALAAAHSRSPSPRRTSRT